MLRKRDTAFLIQMLRTILSHLIWNSKSLNSQFSLSICLIVGHIVNFYINSYILSVFREASNPSIYKALFTIICKERNQNVLKCSGKDRSGIDKDKWPIRTFSLSSVFHFNFYSSVLLLSMPFYAYFWFKISFIWMRKFFTFSLEYHTVLVCGLIYNYYVTKSKLCMISE